MPIAANLDIRLLAAENATERFIYQIEKAAPNSPEFIQAEKDLKAEIDFHGRLSRALIY